MAGDVSGMPLQSRARSAATRSTASRAIVKRIEKERLVALQPFGRAYKIILANTVHPLLFEAEFTRRAETLKNKDFRVMSEYFRRLPSKLFILLLFGSHAKRTQRNGSDIDLMFIVPNHVEPEVDPAQRPRIPDRIGQEAMMHNIILYGIESYYELIR